MRTRFAVVSGFWKNDRAAVRAVKQYNTIIYYFIYYLYYYIINIYNLLFDSPSSLIIESLSVTHSLLSLSSPSSSHRMSSSDPSKELLMQHFLKDLMIMLSGAAFHSADTHRASSEGAALLIFPVSVNSRAGSEIQVRYCLPQPVFKGLVNGYVHWLQHWCHSTRDVNKLSFHPAELVFHGISEMPPSSILFPEPWL